MLEDAFNKVICFEPIQGRSSVIVIPCLFLRFALYQCLCQPKPARIEFLSVLFCFLLLKDVHVLYFDPVFLPQLLSNLSCLPLYPPNFIFSLLQKTRKKKMKITPTSRRPMRQKMPKQNKNSTNLNNISNSFKIASKYW